MHNDKQVAIRIPGQWFEVLTDQAPGVIPNLVRTGPRGQFAEVVRYALSEFARTRGIELEGGKNDQKA